MRWPWRGSPPRAVWPLPVAMPCLVAHRGGSHLFPENTLEAFQGAAERYGCRFLELDVHATADGVPVVLHDEKVDRTTDGHGRVCDLTWAQVCRLNAAHQFVPVTGEFPAGRRCALPSLEQVLRALPDCLFSIDLKQGDPPCEEQVVQVVRRTGMQERVLLGSARQDLFARIRRTAPELHSFCTQRAALLLYAQAHLPGWPRRRPPHDSLQVPERVGALRYVTPRLLDAMHRLELPVIVWTVNNPADMARLLRMGVDGIMTDRPDLWSGVLHSLRRADGQYSATGAGPPGPSDAGQSGAAPPESPAGRRGQS